LLLLLLLLPLLPLPLLQTHHTLDVVRDSSSSSSCRNSSKDSTGLNEAAA